MPSSHTANTGIEKPATGEQSGTWGDTVNTNSDIIDRALNGVGAITLSGTTHTLTTTDGTLTDGMFKCLVLGGSPSGTNTITVAPNTADKIYYVINNSGQTAIFSQGSGANATVLNGDTAIIACDGAGGGAAVTDITSNFGSSSVNITGGSITGITDLAVADGGTGAGTFTDGGVLLGSGTGAITAMSVLTDGQMIVGDGTGDPVAESGATLRTSIGVAIGSDVQAFDADTAKTDVAQSYTKAQRGTLVTLSSSSNATAVDFSLGNNYTLTLGENSALTNPSNETAGQAGSILIIQDGTGSRTLSYGTHYLFAGGTDPTLSTAGSSVDRLDYFIQAADKVHCVLTKALA